MQAVDAEYQRHDAVSAKAIIDELTEVYARVYDTPPYTGDPFFSVASFHGRLEAAFDTGGFETVTARQEGRIVGYVHGATLPTDKPWWTSLGDRRPGELRTRERRDDHGGCNAARPGRNLRHRTAATAG